jgi:hypothetical protein
MSAMDRSSIERALTELAGELRRESLHADVFVVGGAAITLAFEDRPATKDVDAVFTNPTRVRAAAERVGARLDLPPNWLNDGVKGFLPRSIDPDAREDPPGSRSASSKQAPRNRPPDSRARYSSPSLRPRRPESRDLGR